MYRKACNHKIPLEIEYIAYKMVTIYANTSTDYSVLFFNFTFNIVDTQRASSLILLNLRDFDYIEILNRFKIKDL